MKHLKIQGKFSRQHQVQLGLQRHVGSSDRETPSYPRSRAHPGAVAWTSPRRPFSSIVEVIRVSVLPRRELRNKLRVEAFRRWSMTHEAGIDTLRRTPGVLHLKGRDSTDGQGV